MSSIRANEQMEMIDAILPNPQQFLPNGRGDKKELLDTIKSKKVTVLLSLLIVLALICFVREWTSKTNECAKMEQLENELRTLQKSDKQIGRLFRIDQQTENNWNRADCSADLLINEKRKSLQRKADNGTRLCRAKLMVPRHFGIFYFESEIIHLTSTISIGLVPKEMPLDKPFWTYNGAYMYSDDGQFWGHSVEGSTVYDAYGESNYYIGGKSAFGVGDVIGCGLDLSTRQIIYTLNGQQLDTSNLFVSSVDLYPAVSIWASLDAVEANFGPIFRFNLSKEYGGK